MKGDRNHVVQILDALALRLGSYFVGGSGPLALRDLRCVGDLDIGVTTGYWFELQADPEWAVVTPDQGDFKRACDPPYLSQTVYGVPVHVFFSWRHRSYQKPETHDFNEIFLKHVTLVDDWPCLDLDILLRQKVEAVREKDLRDIALIANLLGMGGV